MTESAVGKVMEDRRFLFGVTFAAAVLAFAGALVTYDVWWHLKAGRLILETWTVPGADPFSFTAAGRPWIYHSWLSGLLLTGVWEAAGTTGLIFMRALLIAVSLMIAWGAARQRGVGAGLASVLVLAACLQLEVRALARPYLFSFVLFVVFAMVLQGRGRRSALSGAAGQLTPLRSVTHRFAQERSFLWGSNGRLVLLPFLTVLWANMHAGFISGLLLLGAYGAGEMAALAAARRGRSYGRMLLAETEGARFRAMVTVGVLCLLASLITPYGPGVLLYPFRLLRDVKLVERIQEWQPTPVRADFAVFWAMVVIGGLIIVRSFCLSAAAGRLRQEVGQFVTDGLLMGGFSFLAVRSVRHMAWLLLLAPAIVGYHVGVARGVVGAARQPRRLYAYAAFVLALVIGVRLFVTDGPPRLSVSEDTIPVRACDYMEARGLSYRLYNSYEWGGYLIWRFWPDLKVFIDGRCLVYGDEIIGQAIAVEDGEPGWEDVFDRWDVRMFLVRYRKRDSTHLFADGRWRCVYWDDLAVIGLRDDVFGAHGAGLEEFPLSNPVLFDQTLKRAAPEQILRELHVVLGRDPTCWTALAFRARCLVRLAEKPGSDRDRRDELLQAALRSARQAVELRESYQTWLAVSEAASALGQDELSEEAAGKAERRRPSKARRH